MIDSPAWQLDQSNEVRSGEKNRADHRHHAMDALVVALTNRKRLQKLSDIIYRRGVRRHGEVLDEPWKDFRKNVVEKVSKINVSHRVQRKVTGSLPDETYYGPTRNSEEWVVRKPVGSLSAMEVERIRDKTILSIVLDRLMAAGITVGRSSTNDLNQMKAALANLTMPSGVPIKKVRITKPDQTIRPLRTNGGANVFVKPGNTHHLCIFEYREGEKTKREAVFVTMLEALQRLQRHESVIQRVHPSRPDARFVMSLSSRESVLMTIDGVSRILTFKTAASTQGQIYFVDQYDARRSKEMARRAFKANTLRCRKVTVDRLGRVRWANY